MDDAPFGRNGCNLKVKCGAKALGWRGALEQRSGWAESEAAALECGHKLSGSREDSAARVGLGIGAAISSACAR